MKKDIIKNAVKNLRDRAKSNTLSEEARAIWEEVATAIEALESDEAEHNKTEIFDRIAEIEAKYAEENKAVAESLAKLRADFEATRKNKVEPKSRFTKEVCNAIALALTKASDRRSAEAEVMEVAKKNDITGLDFNAIVDYAIVVKQEDNDPIFSELHETVQNKFFVAEIDPDNAAQIAKQWNGLGVDVTEKEIQELALDGVTIPTKNIYKRQRVSNDVVDDVEEAGQATNFQTELKTELRRGVQGIAVRSLLIGDTVNPDGSKVTTFYTIGTKTESDLFTTVVETAGATPVMSDFRKAADAVKFDYKIAVMTSATKLALSTRVYAQGGSEIMLSDEELAAQIGVNKIYTRDFISAVDDLYAVIFNPNEYWVKIKKERDNVYPQYEKNVLNFQYEKNMGGHPHGVQSCAVLRRQA